MADTLLSTKTLEDILQRTRGALESGRREIYQVAEAAREECAHTKNTLDAVRRQLHQTSFELNELDRGLKSARQRLYDSNKEYLEYTEQQKHEIYQETAKIRETLIKVKERERLLRQRISDLEQTLVRLEDIANRAENLISQVGVVLNYLSGSMLDVNEQLENMYARESAGQEMLLGQEIERKRMASALHDGPVQDLANLVVQMEICERLYRAGSLPEAGKSYQSLKRIVQGSLGELRRVIYDLNPVTLDDLGLVLTLKNCLDNLTAQTAIKTRFVLLGEETRLDPQIERAIFRIVREAMHNSSRHAQAELIEVKVEFAKQHIAIEIKDNGVGFDLQEVQDRIRTGRHHGLLSMQSLVGLLHGSMSVKGAAGTGTRILVQIPLQSAKREVVK